MSALSAKVAELETAKRQLEQGMEYLRRDLAHAYRTRDEWESNAEEAQRDLDKFSGEVLIDGTDYVPWADLPKYAENHVKALREARHAINEQHLALPRVITADELKVGQMIAAEAPVESWYVGRLGEDGLIIDAYSGARLIHADRAKTLFLLADAPEEEPEVQLHRVGGPEWQVMVDGLKPVVTVKELAEAPIGSKYTAAQGFDELTKREDGNWYGQGGRYHALHANLVHRIAGRRLLLPTSAPRLKGDFCSHCMTTHPSS